MSWFFRTRIGRSGLTACALALFLAGPPTLSRTFALDFPPDDNPEHYVGEEAYGIGVRLYNQGDYLKAIRFFSRNIQNTPEFAEAYLNRGLCYEATRDWKRAIADFTSVIRLRSSEHKAYLERGHCYGAMGDVASALPDFDRVIVLKPNNATVYQFRGDTYAASRAWEKAIADYTIYLDKVPNDPEKPEFDPVVYYNRAICYCGKRDYTRSARDMDHFITLLKATSPAPQEAIDLYTDILRQSPRNPEALRGRALAYSRTQDWAKAAEDWDMLCRLQPDNLESVKNSGIAHFNHRDYPEALRLLRIYASQRPDDTTVPPLIQEALKHPYRDRV